MKEILFKDVSCKAYLRKKKRKYCIPNDVDETVEEDDVIKLGFGARVEQNKFELIHDEFSGVCCGICKVYEKKEYNQDYCDEGGYDYIYTNDISPIKVAKVYYANNKSRLVPLEFVDLLEE